MDIERNCSSNSELLFFILIFLLLFYDDKCIEIFRTGKRRIPAEAGRTAGYKAGSEYH
jgi:hypothetical protein